MALETKWINLRTKRRTKSIHNWKDDDVYQAHSIETTGFTPYVKRTQVADRLKSIKETGDLKALDVLINELSDSQGTRD